MYYIIKPVVLYANIAAITGHLHWCNTSTASS